MFKQLQILNAELLEDYLLKVPKTLKESFNNLKEAEISNDNFNFYISVSSVFSSKIEGIEIDLDNYVKHKNFGIKFLPDYTKKIDDLYSAYIFAKNHRLNKTNISKAHKLLSKSILTKDLQGKLRKNNMFVLNEQGKIEYIATLPTEIEKEMQKLYSDIEFLLNIDLKIEEIFYFASYIHLVFVKIHPWADGNGRTARLLEKWFLAEKLGETNPSASNTELVEAKLNKAWFIQSEKKYYENHQTYYNNISALGMEYPELNYKKALPFLLMLVS